MERMRGALETFVRYVPRELVRDLIQSGEQIEVGGVKCEVTLLFTDIEGFTTLTEK
jgi:adenylate cyclase